MLRLNDSGVVFVEQPRGYWLDGKKLEGITTAITRVLNPEMLDLDNLSANHRCNVVNAGDYGSGVHKAIQNYIKEDLLFGSGYENEVAAFDSFCSANGLTPIDSEYLVTDYEYFASAIDVPCVDEEGKIVLVDTKTSRTYNKEYCSIQLSKYREMFELVNSDLKVDRAMVFQINLREGKEPINKAHKVRFKSRKYIKELYANEVKYWTTNKLEKVEQKLPVSIETLMGNIKTVKQEIEKNKELEKKFSQRLLEEFNKYGIESLENEDLIISKRKAYIRSGFDAKRFKVDHPDIHKEYETQSQVKESILIKLR